MLYSKLRGLVLKKQNYKEADQIATVYTKEVGKVRCVARSVRVSLSKLAGSFQDFSVVEFEVTSGKFLPILVSSKNILSFSKIKTDLAKTAMAFYAAELVMRLTADEQPNAVAYDLVESFFKHLEQSAASEGILLALTDSFSLKLLDCLGFSIEHAKKGLNLDQTSLDLLHLLQFLPFAQLEVRIHDTHQSERLHKTINQFIEYIMERSIKSESFLKNI